jgi:hypothetical protein
MTTRHSIDFERDDEMLFQTMLERSEYSHISNFFRTLVRKEAERRGITDDVDLDDLQEDNKEDTIQYDPYNHTARYSLTKDELTEIIVEYDHPEINPHHLPANLPSQRRMKGEIAAACYRYLHNGEGSVENSKLTKVVKKSVGVGSQGRLLSDRVSAARSSFMPMEISPDFDGQPVVLPGDNTRPVLGDLIWHMWHTHLAPNLTDIVEDGLQSRIEKAERTAKLNLDESAVKNRIADLNVIIQSAEENGRDELRKEAEEVRERLTLPS